MATPEWDFGFNGEIEGLFRFSCEDEHATGYGTRYRVWVFHVTTLTRWATSSERWATCIHLTLCKTVFKMQD